MNGQYALCANKSRCLSVGADVPSLVILPLWPKEEREVPAWSRSHPLLIEHLSLLVTDVSESCSCVCTNGGDGRETDRESEKKKYRSRHPNRGMCKRWIGDHGHYKKFKESIQ